MRFREEMETEDLDSYIENKLTGSLKSYVGDEKKQEDFCKGLSEKVQKLFKSINISTIESRVKAIFQDKLVQFKVADENSTLDEEAVEKASEEIDAYLEGKFEESTYKEYSKKKERKLKRHLKESLGNEYSEQGIYLDDEVSIDEYISVFEDGMVTTSNINDCAYEDSYSDDYFEYDDLDCCCKNSYSNESSECCTADYDYTGDTEDNYSNESSECCTADYDYTGDTEKDYEILGKICLYFSRGDTVGTVIDAIQSEFALDLETVVEMIYASLETELDNLENHLLDDLTEYGNEAEVFEMDDYYSSVCDKYNLEGISASDISEAEFPMEFLIESIRNQELLALSEALAIRQLKESKKVSKVLTKNFSQESLREFTKNVCKATNLKRIDLLNLLN